MKFSLPLLCAALIVTSLPAQAQRFEYQTLQQQVNRLQRDVQYLQRQGAGGGTVAPRGTALTNTAQVTAEIAAIQEEMRMIRGEMQSLRYENEQLKKQIQTLQEDIEFRLQELESGGAAPSAPAANADRMTQNTPAPTAPADTASEVAQGATGDAPYPADAAEPIALPSGGAPRNARELYNQAFKQLNQTNYVAAERDFTQFTKQYSDDPLIGNAWYWLGESFYVRRDYPKAANAFRQGYQKLPEGPKAGDNLLKLGMSLANLDKKTEACVVFKQVDQKYGANSQALRSKTLQEINRLDCR